MSAPDPRKMPPPDPSMPVSMEERRAIAAKIVAEKYASKNKQPRVIEDRDFFAHRRPQWPVVHPEPDSSLTVAAMRWSDVGVAALATAFSYGVGYVVAPYPRTRLRGPTAATAATIGMTFGAMYAVQNTWIRLMGYTENAREVKRFGTFPLKSS
uniref:NADH-ubiquinone oxidoreductase 21kDa subunit N-terminal domain-containing protein n=1 Tax=Corethron hystrix TaxID=216773 RepID=A0A7S1FYI5_9STRA